VAAVGTTERQESQVIVNDAATARAAQNDAKTELVEDGFINIRPTEQGYANVASLFAEQIMQDVRKGRQASDRELLVSVIQIAAYLGQRNEGALLAQIEARLSR
jgi:hypothetical protein